MYALSFDMTVADLTASYPGKQYNNAYYEIKRELANMGLSGYRVVLTYIKVPLKMGN